MKTFVVYDLDEAVVSILFAIPFTLVALVAVLYFFNAFYFYKQLTQLIHRRYKDSVEWEQVKKYIEKF